MKFLFNIFLVLVVLVIIAGILIYMGIFNVAATKPHNIITKLVLEATVERSVAVHSKAIEVPADISSTDRIDRGFGHYNEMCVICHGAPGKPISEIARGLYPLPPSLIPVATELNGAELFWVIKNGLKMTGMPAFSSTHSDQQIWDIVAFVRKLPDISAAEYEQMVKKYEPESPQNIEQ